MASRVAELPEGLQLRILSLVVGEEQSPAPRSVAPDAPTPPSAAARARPAPEGAQLLALGLAAHGFAIAERHLADDAARALVALAAQLVDEGALRPAKVGQSLATREDASARADSLAWVELEHAALRPLAARLRELCAAASEALGEPLELPRSAMLARYPAGSAGYRLHRDASELTARRRVTAILYLNENWAEADGGELELRLGAGERGAAAPTLRVCPELNRAVFFRSSLEHRVLPNSRARLALTVWLERRAAPAPDAGISEAGPELARARSALAAAVGARALGAGAGPDEPLAAAPLSAAPASSGAPAAAAAAAAEPALATIFVSIPAYRDPEAQHTLHDLFARAARPERVSAGLVWQGDVEAGADAHCFVRQLPAEWAARVRTHWMHWREARGPTLARALAQALWRGETHYLQVDSHTRFADGWDAQLLAQLALAEADAAERARARGAASAEPARAIITTYPAWYERPDTRSTDDRPPLMCARAAGGDAFGQDGLLRLRARTLAQRPARPVPSLFWAAGFAFSKSSAIVEVPYDGALPFLFFGEEAAMGARLWTSGYDFYAPTTNLVFHLWDRSYRETFWQLADARDDKPRSIERVQRLLAGAPAGAREAAAAGATGEAGAPRDADAPAAYGLGRVRSLAEYEAWCGVSFGARTATARAARGGADADTAFAAVFSRGGAGGEDDDGGNS